ncbi:MAG: nuclear transport factor 2 family protein [Chitinophagaceae bacterium]|nr:nuclear transport factor 2 family protein [Chitinophagaceae bacterium]
MNRNTAVIENFYSAFQRLDYRTMNSCYSDDIMFNDPVFGVLQGDVAKSMWEMLCKSAKDFTLTYSNILLLDDEYATCNWTARYTFSKTKRPVINQIKAHMRLIDGEIVEHTDQFDLWKWSRQALGFPGLLFGWSGYIKNKVAIAARKNLEEFIAAKNALVTE